MRKFPLPFVLTAVAVVLASCTSADDAATFAPATLTFSSEQVFPADRSLLRPEDGALLPDGRLVVGDQEHGLRLVEEDGTSRPFGNMRAAGYEHEPPLVIGGANGVTLTPDGAHVIVADVLRGGIFRVDIAAEVTELLYRHPYGVNTARADRTGAIWFTQSARNTPDSGPEGLVATLDNPAAEGMLLRLPPGDAVATVIDDGLFFPNGIALDEANGYIYLAETIGNRVLRFALDVEGGSATDRTEVLQISVPDNIELDGRGGLWLASAGRSEIVRMDLATGSAVVVYRGAEPADEALTFSELLATAFWEPLPGVLTGLILSATGELSYGTTLGDAIIRIRP
jgi:sugar lactone lactonase YvrE